MITANSLIVRASATTFCNEDTLANFVDSVERVLDEHLAAAGTHGTAGTGNELTLDDVLSSDVWARSRAHEICGM